MKIGMLERMAIRNGRFGILFAVAWAAGIGGIGGFLIGAFVSGIVSAFYEIDEVVQLMIVSVFGVLGFVLIGRLFGRKLSQLGNQSDRI